MKKPKIIEQSVSLKKSYRSVRIYDVEQVLDEKLSYDPVRNPETLATIAEKLIGDKDREHFLVIAFNTKHEVIGTHIAHVGQLNSSLMHLREIFKILIMCNAGAYALAHNYPSGKAEPSKEDVEVTSRMIDIGYLMRIPLLDHFIVNGSREYSLREHAVIHRLDFNSPSSRFEYQRMSRIL
ncbi:JAB domain-containing protein [Exiguobacterium artemiae]|uniref:JAB domain-containing protein n=1 Tax=Exiguobacterium artemiae TaxID=340145 RepID=UPI002963ECCF|nr:JAB domain-containing protein [Exiguobacterium sibiricum]MDW2886699.1 JAB domain-containing protein [Exiguobacterium sibiricum]